MVCLENELSNTQGGKNKTPIPQKQIALLCVVRAEGLEPPRLAPPEPKSGVSTNFTTPA